MTNFSARIAATAERFPSHVAIELARPSGIEGRTYAQLMTDAAAVAAWLIGARLRAGDRCAILADNSPQWVAAYLGVLGMGAVAVPLDTAYKASQVKTILESSGALVILTTPKYIDTTSAACAAMAGAAPQVRTLADAVATAAGASPPVLTIVDVDPADAAVILYTSGTTADPKGVVLTHANLDAERLAVLAIVEATETDAVLGVLPLFHALAQMANLLLPLSVGARVVFLETVSSGTLLEALQSRGITIFACVPQFFYLIHQRVTAELARAGFLRKAIARGAIGANVRLRDLLRLNIGRLVFAKVHRALGPSMRVLVTGGSRFDPAIGRDLYGMGFTLQNAYGLTETSGAATIQRTNDKFTTSVGQPLPGVEVSIAGRIAGERSGESGVPASESARRGAGGPADPTEDGEILLRGPIIMREYFNRPDATADSLVDGWLRTGDLGRLDDRGRLYITGRLKEIIVLSSGKNLYPEEIEAHYRQTPFFKELCVLGLARPGEPAAERLHAVVVPDEQVLRERGIVNLRELVRFEIETLAAQLPAHKRVLSYDISLAPLPRTTTGKLKRREIERDVLARAAAATRADDRPTTDEERAWLATAAHQEAIDQIAARLARAVRPDANLELDLGLDSMERVELLTMLERNTGRQVSPAVRATMFTVRQLVDGVLAAPPVEQGQSRSDGELAWDTVLAQSPDAALVENLQRSKLLVAMTFFVVLKVTSWLARVVPGYRVSGVENLPSAGPFIISPNHQIYLDPLFVLAALPLGTLRQVFFVGAAEYFQTPLSAWFAKLVNIVPVDPDANLVRAMQAGAAGLRLKKVLILFPEGERSIDGRLKPFRKGAAILAAHLDAPIVPAALDGLFPFWPRGRRFNWRGLIPGRSAPIRLTFGQPIQVTPGQYEDGTARLRQAVETMLDQPPR